mmetsp:Transcript_86615/g.250132  ORF Transcript_86615/g.250132 Transcript_86615/m.250132 type:complete len:359 (-) Transcript_86615:1053-2129(-)
MHVLQRRPVVIAHGQLVRGLNQVLVVDPWMRQVVAYCRDQDPELLDVREERRRADQLHLSPNRVRDIDRMGEVVERIRQVLRLHNVHEVDEPVLPHVRANPTSATLGGFHHVDGQRCLHLLRQIQRVKVLRLEGLQDGFWNHVNVCLAGARHEFVHLHCGPSAPRLRVSQADELRALHPIQNHDFVLIHVLLQFRLPGNGGQLCDRSELADRLLKEGEFRDVLHVVVVLLGIGLVVLQVHCVLEDLLATLPHHGQHPLERLQRHDADAAAGDQAETAHHNDDEADEAHVRRRFHHVGHGKVKVHAHSPLRYDPRRGRTPGRCERQRRRVDLQNIGPRPEGVVLKRLAVLDEEGAVSVV